MEEIKRKDPRKGLESETQNAGVIGKHSSSTETQSGKAAVSQNKSEENVAPSGEIVTNTGANLNPEQGDADAASG